jgi:hypothetical protein
MPRCRATRAIRANQKLDEAVLQVRQEALPSWRYGDWGSSRIDEQTDLCRGRGSYAERG